MTRRSAALSRGFTLIEVLVALAIVAIALLAGAQATSALTRNIVRQTNVVLAHVCAENELVKVRLMRQMPDFGDAETVCEQAGHSYRTVLSTTPTPNPQFRRVDAQVYDAQYPVLRISTIVGRY